MLLAGAEDAKVRDHGDFAVRIGRFLSIRKKATAAMRMQRARLMTIRHEMS
jgi:hypothetical protein